MSRVWSLDPSPTCPECGRKAWANPAEFYPTTGTGSVRRYLSVCWKCFQGPSQPTPSVPQVVPNVRVWPKGPLCIVCNTPGAVKQCPNCGVGYTKIIQKRAAEYCLDLVA